MKKITLIFLILMVSFSVHASSTVFKAPDNLIRDWLLANGYGWNVKQGLIDYFVSISPLSSGTLNDHIHRVLGDLGYTGTLQDRINTFMSQETGDLNPVSAEFIFWSDSTNNFDDSSGSFSNLVDESNNELVDESNNILAG